MPLKTSPELPAGFVIVNYPGLLVDLAYAGADNFIGQPIDGYEENVLILTEPAAKQLMAALDMLQTINERYSLKIYDAYRPERAVQHFVRWSKDLKDTKNQAIYYPHLNKAEIFEQGYVSCRSTHSRGSTVDLTIVFDDGHNYQELDMGSIFDYFDDVSHLDYKGITPEQKANRELLRKVMEDNGFVNYPIEWWHYTLADEPFPDSYFDFVIKK